MTNAQIQIDDLQLVKIEEAAEIVGKTVHNIRDYIQRGRIAKYNIQGQQVSRVGSGELRVSLLELTEFNCSIARVKTMKY
jgi:hypothetical protein